MQDRPIEAAERALDGLPWALLIYLAFVVYGSLLPFEPRPPPTAGAWEAFLRLPYLELGVASRADWVANLLLYIPLGFLIVGSAQGRGGANLIHASIINTTATASYPTQIKRAVLARLSLARSSDIVLGMNVSNPDGVAARNVGGTDPIFRIANAAPSSAWRRSASRAARSGLAFSLTAQA